MLNLGNSFWERSNLGREPRYFAVNLLEFDELFEIEVHELMP